MSWQVLYLCLHLQRPLTVRLWADTGYVQGSFYQCNATSTSDMLSKECASMACAKVSPAPVASVLPLML